MPNQCNFIAHRIFDHCLDQLKEVDPEIEEKVNEQVRIIKGDPLSGATLKGAPPGLQGRIRKKYVGGQKGHRLLYIHFPGKGTDIAVGVFITPVSRKDYDCASLDFELFLEASEDFGEQKMENFRVIP